MKQKKMKVLLLGSTGMAGTALKKSLELRKLSVTGIARTNSDYDCDLTDEENLSNVLSMKKYDLIVNSAALVNIDYCEENSFASWMINSKLVSVLANWSNKKIFRYYIYQQTIFTIMVRIILIKKKILFVV